jgi:lysozyme family protein
MTYKINSVFREFLLALDFILKWEGGLSNDSKDYGGVTYTGIKQDSYDTFCRRVSKNRKLVKDLTKINVVDFYWLDRYIPYGADKLLYLLSLVVFDTSVLFSVETSFSFVNEYLYKGPISYSIKGMKVLLEQVKANKSIANIALGICDCREKEHRRVASKDSSQKVFLDGWLNRLNNLRTIIKQYKEKKESLWRYKTQTSPHS